MRIKDVKERSVEGVRVMQVAREVDWADNTTTFTIELRLIGPDRSFSLVSDFAARANGPRTTSRAFLRRMIDIAGIKEPVTQGTLC